MDVYKEMYMKLNSVLIDIEKLIKKAQLDTEEIFISTDFANEEGGL